MIKTHIYILVPQYYGVTGTIQSAYELASSIQPEGPIQFHLVDYPEQDPIQFLEKDDDWDGMVDITPAPEMNVRFSINFDYEATMLREDSNDFMQYLEQPRELLDRMAAAEDFMVDQYSIDVDNSLVLLLNPYGNSHNYFCGPSPERKSAAFVQVTHRATETLTARFIPVAYELFAAALRFRAFNVPDYQERFAHMEDQACVNDFFSVVRNIRFKILSADVCESCYSQIQRIEIPIRFMDHVIEGLEAVRKEQLSYQKALRDKKTLSAKVTQRFIHFEQLNAKVGLSPKQMTLYKFYLNHPEGVPNNEIADHRGELKELYEQHYIGHPEDMSQDVFDVVERWANQDPDLAQTVSKINSKIKGEISPILAKPHLIKGGRGARKRILAVDILFGKNFK